MVLGDARLHRLTLLEALESSALAGKWKRAFTHHDDKGHSAMQRAMGTGLVEKRKVKQAKTRIAAAHFTTS